jgi:hypothetical protein
MPDDRLAEYKRDEEANAQEAATLGGEVQIMTDDHEEEWDREDDVLERFEQALLKAVKPGEQVQFAVVMEMTRKEDGTNVYTFSVSSEGDGEVLDAHTAEMLAHGLQTMKRDYAN